MRSEEFIGVLLRKIENGTADLTAQIPLGMKEDGGILCAREKSGTRAYGVNHTCVTGMGATSYIGRLIAVLSALYKQCEAQFLILSPKSEYAELLRLIKADITAPYIRCMQDVQTAKETYKQLLHAQEKMEKAPKLFLILDGLENLDSSETGDLSIYREFFELSVRKKVEIITGANLIKSIFSGFPGAFVGVGNCLITTDGKAQADATFVAPDSSMSLPVSVAIVSEPSLSETVLFVNAFQNRN